MQKLKSILGYSWAAGALLVSLLTFFGHTYFSRMFAETTGIKVHPRYSGGEVIAVVDHGAYRTSIHRPVFDGLIGQTQEGFVQINWEPSDGLPSVIHEGIDYNQDGREDFVVSLNTADGRTQLIKTSPQVSALERSYHLRNGWAVRVSLKR